MASVTSRREMMKAGLATFGAGMALFSRPDFVFPAQDAAEELVPFQNVPRAKPESLDWETLDAEQVEDIMMGRPPRPPKPTPPVPPPAPPDISPSAPAPTITPAPEAK